MYLPLVAVVAFMLWFVWRAGAEKYRRLDAHWQQLAHRLGLSFRSTTFNRFCSMHGTLDGMAIRVFVEVRNKTPHTVVEVQVHPPLSARLRVERTGLGGRLIEAIGGQDIALADPELDHQLWVHGNDDARIQELLNHSSARPALHLIANDPHRSLIKDGRLILEEVGHSDEALMARIEDARIAARALRDAMLAPWTRAAEEHGLTLDQRPSETSLTGTIEGLSVQVRTRDGDNHPVTQFRVALHDALPAGSRIRAGSDGPTLGDPILDGRIIVEGIPGKSSSHRSLLRWLQGRLHGGDSLLRELLLDVLLGLPDAIVESHAITLTLPGRPGPELGATLLRLVALGAAFSAPLPATTDAPDTP